MDIACKSKRTSNRVIASNSNKLITPYPGSGTMLIINGKWVTTKYISQIQDAIMAKDHVKFFLEKYNTNSEDDYNHISWRGIGQACIKLTDTENINITKYVNGLLNTGYQKGLLGEVSECPCCIWHEETQLHMFQCTSPEMKRTIKASF